MSKERSTEPAKGQSARSGPGVMLPLPVMLIVAAVAVWMHLRLAP
jgi:hypothetical protein